MVASSIIKKGLVVGALLIVLWLLIPAGNVVNKNTGNMREVVNETGSPRSSLVSAAYSPVIDLSDNVNKSLNPAIATDSKNNVHVVWFDDQYDTTIDMSMTSIYYKMFNYTTQTWGNIVNVSLNHDGNIRPGITVDKNDNVHIVWTGRDYQSDWDIYYCNKTYLTGVWGPIINVTQTDADVSSVPLETNPKIAVNSTGDLQVIWEDQTGTDIIKGIVVPGGNWGLATPAVTINSNGANNVRAGSLDLAADQKYFHLIWAVTSSPNCIYYMNSSDGSLQDKGGDAYLLHTSPTAYQPKIFVSNNTGGFVKIYTTWASNIDGYYDILSKNSTDNKFFGAVVNVTRGSSLPDFKLPQITVDSTGLAFFLYCEQPTGGQYVLHMTNSSAYGLSTLVQDLAHNPASDILNNPSLAIDRNGSLHFAWEDDQPIGTYSGSANTDIFYRTYDRYPPQVSITSPGNFTLIGKSITISGTTDPDTQYVNVSYQVRGDTAWNYIGGLENDTMNFRNGWSVNWNPTVSYPNITIRANATDFNGASNEFFIYNVTVDANDPTSINLVNIIDSYGNNYLSGDTNFTGTITVSYTCADYGLGTGVKNVTLYDGSTYLPYGINDTNTQIIFNTGDAVYSNLKLRATDRAGNYLDSTTIPYDIRIDHTAPDAIFKNPLVPFTKFRGTFWIQVNGTGGDMGGDWNHVDFDVSDTGSSWTYIGTNTTANAIAMGADNIGFAYDTSSIFENPGYWLRATVYDNAGQSTVITTQIHVDNNAPDFIIDVDWTEANPVNNFNDDDYGQSVGINVYIDVLCDNDTTMVVYYNKTVSYTLFSTPLLTNTTGLQYSANKKVFRAMWDTFYSGNLTVFIKVVLTDDVGNSNSTDWLADHDPENRYKTNDPGGHGMMLVLEHNVPLAPTQVTATLAQNKTAIIITWTKAADPWLRNKGYIVYRIHYSPDLYWLNLLNPVQMAEYWHFLDDIGVRILQINDPNVNQTTDYNLDPGTYFYIVITINTFDTPSDINNIPGVEVPGQQPVREADTSFDTFLQIVVWALVALWVIIPIAGYSITRNLAKRDLIDFTMDVNVIKGFQGPKSFEKDVSDLDLKMRKELGMDVTSPAETEFLQQEIVKGTPGVEVKETTLKNCPQCGWVLSAGATKCIRCGYVLGTPTDQSKEGKI